MKRATKKTKVKQERTKRKPPFTKAKVDLQGRFKVALHALLHGSVAFKHVPGIGGWKQGWFHLDALVKYGVLEQNEDKTYSVTAFYKEQYKDLYETLYEALKAIWKEECLDEQRRSAHSSARSADSHSGTSAPALS
jgi:hypothetical protein